MGGSRRRWWIAGGAATVIAGALAFGLFGVHTALYDVRAAEEPFEPGAEQMELVARGDFHSVVHAGRGVAEIYRAPDGSHLLRLVDLEVDNGPALHLWMVALDDAKDSASVAEAAHIDLGALEGNLGSQHYALPAAFALDEHRSVTVWCQRFSVNFATAPLSPTKKRE
jgi:hypothetical protein